MIVLRGKIQVSVGARVLAFVYYVLFIYIG